MKDFSYYAVRIADEIMEKYPDRADEAAENSLGCYLLCNEDKDTYAIRENESSHLFNVVPATKELWNAINDYAGKVATYEGELDMWMYKEEQRVHDIARDIIIQYLEGNYSYKVYECENYMTFYKGNDYEKAIYTWIKEAKNNYTTITITAKTKEDEKKLIQYASENIENLSKAFDKYNIPYKTSYMVNGIKTNLEGKQNIQWEHDQIYPFCFG